MPEVVETLVIGAGQAGLAMSHHLQQRGCEHLILERGRIAERWRSERWDSLHFQFPNWMMRLPGHAYQGADRDGFMHREGVVAFIASYAVRIGAPVRCGVSINALQLTDKGRFRVEAGSMSMEAINIVVATGPYQSPRIPEAAARIPAGIRQITANRYTRPSELPPGGVLVVGSGGSGCQIVEDLLLHGRPVHFAVRGHRRVPRRYRGRDFGHWDEEMGLTDRTVDQIPSGFRPPLITGVRGGHTIDLRRMAIRGATLLGSLQGVQDGGAYFAADLNSSLDAGDAAFRETLRSIDAHIATHGVAAQPNGEFDADIAMSSPSLPESEGLDLCRAGIRTVIWALGYGYDFAWIECPVLDGKGTPLHVRGVTKIPGLYFLGLPRLHKIKSAFLWGVGEDAAHIADLIQCRVQRSRGSEA
ncbi:NAD(P)-binding domain-containing protein [Plastoroseomonas hellenica]|uniref:NAD(P)-binding domain-containing protein n=1 Tax=Plastoroseomonas hellenica TaxID=2687306 RepID=UPI001BA46AF2|nr:NAD(P)-binding domain-containing protein [Plastoroseomonas hellenica]MBR0646776.1 NAD(P)-binding domain-containing protein [Plastoroseomonas hellenica]